MRLNRDQRVALLVVSLLVCGALFVVNVVIALLTDSLFNKMVSYGLAVAVGVLIGALRA